MVCDNGIELIAATRSSRSIARARRCARPAGSQRRYDRLLIATGSDPFIIPVPGKDLPGVISFRDMADVDHMLAAADKGATRS
jgi:nitrite reductase (NADH) large subunit